MPQAISLTCGKDHSEASVKGPNLGPNWSQNYDSEAVYIQQQGDRNAVSAMDIAQGQIGDCFFLAALGDIAIKDPAAIYDMISGNGDGTETVKLYQDADGGPAGLQSRSFTQASFLVTNDFSPDAVNNYNTTDIVDGTKEIWAQVAEKAYATDLGGYDKLDQGGYDVDAMETLTGHKAYFQQTSTLSLKELNRLSSNPHSLLTFDTGEGSNLPDNLVGGHAYMFDGLVHQGGQTLVKLLNPWGDTEPNLIAFSDIAKDFDQFNHGRV